MRRGFTLIEMMIVVALIATLMTIVFRLSSVSSNESSKAKTVVHLACLENCLSGYFAAYGNYPPVRLHNTRDIYQVADIHGIQSVGDRNENIWNWTKLGEYNEKAAWHQVEAACRAQPVGAGFPFSGMKGKIGIHKAVRDFSDGLIKILPLTETDPNSEFYKQLLKGFDALDEATLGRLNGLNDATSWRELQLFRFGLMSFLVPRYQLMLGLDDNWFDGDGNMIFDQWTINNPRPPANQFSTGKGYSWKAINKLVKSENALDKVELSNVGTEAIPLRWLPNLEGKCSAEKGTCVIAGIELQDTDPHAPKGLFGCKPSRKGASVPKFNIYSPDSGDSGRGQYVLDGLTVLDGWKNEFYYYSPSPHQSYQLWSAGANGRTFPPWVSRSKLSPTANECVFKWTEDDIKGMSN